jgi:hypothetical protein
MPRVTEKKSLISGISKNDKRDSEMLVELNPLEDPRWDELVIGHPEGTIYHHSAWHQVLCETYGYTPLYLGQTIPGGNKIFGIFSFMLVNSILTGKRVVSLPFTTYCNPLMPEEMLEEAVHFAFKRFSNVDYVELKLVEKVPGGGGQLGVESRFVTHILSLGGGIDDLFRSFHPTSIRQRVRRAERTGLAVRMAKTDSDLRQFYEFYALMRRKNGIPPQPYSFFANMRRILASKDLLEIPVIEFQGRVIAAAILLKFNSTWHLEYSNSDPLFLKESPNQLLIWKCIEMAHRAGAKSFDFGRTALSHQSLLEFKDRWQAQRRGIRYHYFPLNTKGNHLNSRSDGFLVRLNKRLPLALLKWEGRLLYRHMA